MTGVETWRARDYSDDAPATVASVMQDVIRLWLDSDKRDLWALYVGLVDRWGPQYDQDNVGEPQWAYAESLIEDAIVEMGATPLNLARLESWIEHQDCHSTLTRLLTDFRCLTTPEQRRLYQEQLSNFELSDGERDVLMT
ncbi:MAG: hypothetical protein NW217_00380 [Hyphomicrobiaceae bacterium]|nr:hypothetical protein [Hyphomicrobiaceae bacterium]